MGKEKLSQAKILEGMNKLMGSITMKIMMAQFIYGRLSQELATIDPIPCHDHRSTKIPVNR
jgi:hypothetical protein